MNVVGADAVTIEELARIATEVTGDTYRYDPLSDDDWVAARLALGRPRWWSRPVSPRIARCDAASLDGASDDYRALTGKDPIAVAQVVDRLRDAMPLYGPSCRTSPSG